MSTNKKSDVEENRIDNRIIYGTIKSKKDKPAKDAVVILFLRERDTEKMKPLLYGFSDDAGCFAFGPLPQCGDYIVKAWTKNSNSKQMPRIFVNTNLIELY